jgi:outer membrane protein OmpA-like peptidoglycan-associated protein
MLPSRTTTFVLDTTMSTGSMENFREIWVSPKRLPETLAPVGQDAALAEAWGSEGATSLPVRNTRTSYATVSINGVKVGVVDALTNAAVHGVAPGLYEIHAVWQNGYEETRTVATRVVDEPLTPGSEAGAAYVAELAPLWSEDPAMGYAEPPPPPVPPEPPRIVLKAERVEINERVQFAVGSAVIDARSHGLLDEIAALLRDHPELLLLEIQGHTDATGDAASNRTLSEDRAAAVRDYLVTGGVEAERLQSAGYGPDRPLVDGDDPASLARNRRVEILVLERAEPVPDEQLAD